MISKIVCHFNLRVLLPASGEFASPSPIFLMCSYGGKGSAMSADYAIALLIDNPSGVSKDNELFLSGQ